ncbi:MAG: hypothetical protein ABEK10_00405 [Candidatus Nanosalina sp.]
MQPSKTNLNPPININRGGTRQAKLEGGIEEQFKKFEQFFEKAKNGEKFGELKHEISYYRKKYTENDLNRSQWDDYKDFREKGYRIAKPIRVAFGTSGSNGPEDAVSDEKYRTKLKRNWQEKGKYKENMGILITIKMAERHLEFIKELAEWEHHKFGLGMSKAEKKEIDELKKMLQERYEIVYELDKIIWPFIRNNGPDHGEPEKDELYMNPGKALQRLSKAEKYLNKLQKVEEMEDAQIKEQMKELKSILQ